MIVKAYKHHKGFILPVLLGILAIILILALTLYFRFSQQAGQEQIIDQTTVARFFLESYTSDILWQIRKRQNQPATAEYEIFRQGMSERVCNIDYQPCSMLVEMAQQQKIEIGAWSVKLKKLRPLTFNPSAFTKTADNKEKTGQLLLSCEASFQGRNYRLDTAHPFKVVMTTSPILRSFVLFFDQLHLEQTESFGVRDKINVIPVRHNYGPQNQSPLSLYGWDLNNRDLNGKIFLGHDSKEIRLNLVGGTFNLRPPASRLNLEDLWQISPSAFSATVGQTEFDQQELLTDQNGNPLIVRGATIPMVHRGHFARIGLLGFSDELLSPDFLGNFSLENFLAQDPSYQQMRYPEANLKQASALRLFGNQIFADFSGFPRDVYGKVYSRFFLLSFFDAPSIGVPISYNSDPAHSITVPQYGGAQRLPFKPLSGNYTTHMSRIVSGESSNSTLGEEANVPTNKTPESEHKILLANDFAPLDGLKPSRGFSDLAQAWFSPSSPSPDQRPPITTGSALERVSRFFRNDDDFKKGVGLQDPHQKKFWVEGVVYINGPLDLSEGIETDDIRGGIVLVNGEIKLGNVTREIGPSLSENTLREIRAIPLAQVLTFVSLSGEKITLTGNRYYGIQIFSFKPQGSGETQQLEFADGNEMVFIGGIGLSTPQLRNITRQLPNNGVFPYFNYLPALASNENSLAVNIAENIELYEFQVN